MNYDVVIVGGGPAGLAAALTLGRALKRVLLCDAGPRRNARAHAIHNFVTRDGTPPETFRHVGLEQLKPYTTVDVRATSVEAIDGEKGAFNLTLGDGQVTARRVLLCTGVVDDVPPLEGLANFWGHSVYACPYCHGFEVKGQRWGVLVLKDEPHTVPFALQLRGWTEHVTLLTQGALTLSDEARAQLEKAGVEVVEAPVTRLVGDGHQLSALQLTDGREVACEALFAHPEQRQVDLVAKLGPTLSEDGFVEVDPMRLETSIPGVFAAGDLTTRMQAAIAAAAKGMQAGAMINMELTLETVGR